MKSYIIPFVVVCLFIAGCKKDDTGFGNGFCPSNMSYIRHDTALPGTAYVTNVFEDNSGGIHIAVQEEYHLAVFQYTADGTFLGKVNLGNYNSWQLQVYDAYYLTRYTPSTISVSANAIITGWKDFTGRRYPSTGDPCARVFAYDTLTPYTESRTATTTIKKVDFNGSPIWSSTYNGEFLFQPLAFDVNGDMYLSTIDYKGVKWQLLIDGVAFDVPAGISQFKSTDTMRVNESIHSVALTKIDRETGIELWSNKQLLQNYPSNNSYPFNLNVLQSAIWVSTKDFTYTWNKQGGFTGMFRPVPELCYPERSITSTSATADLNGAVSTVVKYDDWITSFARLDAAGNKLWETSPLDHARYLCSRSGGFVVWDNPNVDFYDDNGGLAKSYTSSDYLQHLYPNQNTSQMLISIKMSKSCSGDLLQAIKVSNDELWLLRTNSNGDLP